MKLTDYIRSKYSNQNVTLQEKSVTLFFLTISIGVGFLVLAVTRFIEGEITKSLLEAIVALLLFFFSLLIFKKHFQLVSILTMIVFYAAGIFLYQLNPPEGRINLFIAGCYLIPVILTTPLLAFKSWQIILSTIVAQGTQIYAFFSQVNPLAEANNLPSPVFDFVVVSLLILMSGLFSYQLFVMQVRSLKEIEKSAATEKKRLGKFTSVIDTTSHAFNVGEQLQSSANITLDSSKQIAGNLENMRDSIEELLENVRKSSDANAVIIKAREEVEEQTDMQNEAIGVSSAASEQMSAQIRQISQAATSREKVITKLVESAETSREKLQDSVSFFKQIAVSSEEIIEVISVIEEISGRTNLLAMNAAIEAAHAGESGKGFAVVAEEIRKLAEETNANSQLIRATLEKNNDQVQNSVRSTNELGIIFEDVSTNIAEVQEVMEGIISSMHELNTGAASITSSVENLQNSKQKVAAAINNMKTSVSSGVESIDRIYEAADVIADQIDFLSELAGKILSSSDELNNIGKQNISNFTQLQDEIRKIKE